MGIPAESSRIDPQLVRLAERFGLDEEVAQAASEVDRSLILWSLSLSLSERLRACSRATSALGRLRVESS